MGGACFVMAHFVMAGLDPAIYLFQVSLFRWMPASGAGMTV